MRDLWECDMNLTEFASFVFGIIVANEAAKVSEVLGREVGNRLMTMSLSVGGVDTFSRFAWNNFGINLYVIMTEIKRMVEEMDDDDWDSMEQYINRKCKQYEEEESR